MAGLSPAYVVAGTGTWEDHGVGSTDHVVAGTGTWV
jgi:hypothetical protein